VHLVTPISARLAQPLIRGLHNEVIVRDRAATRDFPQIVPSGFDEEVERALDRYRSVGAETTWFDAFDLHTLPSDFTGAKEGMLVDVRVRRATVPPDRIAAVFSSLGGRRGWLVADGLWRLRGWLDRAVGGVGLRRGRRSVSDLRVGDAVDFWRVEAYEPGRLLRLRAEMKLPGLAWLQFEAEADGNGGATLRQTAFFEPHGLFGVLYWYSVAPFHAWGLRRDGDAHRSRGGKKGMKQRIARILGVVIVVLSTFDIAGYHLSAGNAWAHESALCMLAAWRGASDRHGK
jgi:hypothetical protein